MKRIAVVILNWNGSEMLQHFLPSAIKHSQDMADVYVADNGSTDDTVSMMFHRFPHVKLIALDENFGFAEGYNRALKEVENEFVVMLNSDVEVTSGWLQPMLEYMDAHPEVAGCQPKILNYYNRAYFEYSGAAGGYLDCWGFPFCRGRVLNRVEKDEGQYDTVAPVFWASGAAFFIRRQDYFAAGGLDGRFFAHMEEVDLCWRLRARGRDLVCIPQSVVYHVGGATLSKSNPRKTLLNFRNNLLMLYKNLPARQLHAVLFMRFILDYVALCLFLVRGHWGDACAVRRARREYHFMKSSYRLVRRANLKLAKMDEIPERSRHSVFFYALFRRNKFRL